MNIENVAEHRLNNILDNLLATATANFSIQPLIQGKAANSETNLRVHLHSMNPLKTKLSKYFMALIDGCLWHRLVYVCVCDRR